MISSLLPQPLDFTNCLSLEEQEELAYKFFKENIRNQEIREKYKETEIKLRLTPPYYEGKEEVFEHLTGFSETEKYKDKPCKETTLPEICLTKCTTDNIPLNQRNLCLFRASLLPWFNGVIRLANNDNPHIKCWENIRIDKKNRKQNRSLLIRFQHETADYLIVIGVFEKNGKKNYQLRTAYPLFFNYEKQKLDKEYEKYMKDKK